jgi:DUF4097 and DUF4098 domain-containing protein YvlB
MLRSLCIALLAGGLSTAAWAEDNISKVNGSIRVESGRTVGELDTVNGSINLGDNARATSIETVNGSIEIGDGASAESADTVNGRVSIGARVRISGDLESVNGALTVGDGSDITGKVANVNGTIRLTSAHVGGGIETINGDIDVGAGSRVEGGILVEKPHGFSWGKNKNPRVVIGPHAVVDGTLDFRREVDLYVSDTAKIGTITGATANKFAGDHP